MFGQSVDADFIRVDTLNIRFHLDSIRIDMGYANNEASWRRFERNFFDQYANRNPHTLRIDIYSGASPEGTPAHNRWLGENRGIAVRRLIRSSFGNRVGNIVMHNEAARWEDFYDAIAASNEPWRDEVLRILERPTSKNQDQRDERELLLRQLHDGSVWTALVDKYLSPLRSGATAILSFEVGRDTVIVRESSVVYAPTPAMPPSTSDVSTTTDRTAQKSYQRRPAWILRTNLPILGVGTPNFQAEWSLDHKDRWSFNVEGIFSWWTFSRNTYANEIIYGSAEIRYWLGNRKNHHTLDGWHVGLAAGGGLYDLEWKSKGYQGEALMGFINVGWQRRFGKRRQWAFDAGIGLGYLFSPYRRYLGSTLFPENHKEEYNDHLMWQETKTLNWFGTPHVNISLGYVFEPKNGPYRRAVANHRDEINSKFIDSERLLEIRLDSERDSVYSSWLQMSSAQRKVARRAYEENTKAERKEARERAKVERAAHKARMRGDYDADQQSKAVEKAIRKQAAADAKAAKQVAKENRAKKDISFENAVLAHDAAERATARELAKQAKAEKEAKEKAEKEAAKIKAAEAKEAAKKQAEAKKLAEEKAKAEKEAKERAETEAARIKAAEQKAAAEKAKAEKEAKERAEKEAKKLAEAKAKADAEKEAKKLAEEKAKAEKEAKERAEKEAAKIKAAEAKAAAEKG